MHTILKSLMRGIGIGALCAGFVQNTMAMEGPDVVELNTLTNLYEAVTFDHAMHVDVASCVRCHHHSTGQPAEDVACVRCHADSGPTDEVACADCHIADPSNTERLMNKGVDGVLFHTDRAGLKRAYHINCMGCHQEMDAPTGCEDCHPKSAAESG